MRWRFLYNHYTVTAVTAFTSQSSSMHCEWQCECRSNCNRRHKIFQLFFFSLIFSLVWFYVLSPFGPDLIKLFFLNFEGIRHLLHSIELIYNVSQPFLKACNILTMLWSSSVCLLVRQLSTTIKKRKKTISQHESVAHWNKRLGKWSQHQVRRCSLLHPGSLQLIMEKLGPVFQKVGLFLPSVHSHTFTTPSTCIHDHGSIVRRA